MIDDVGCGHGLTANNVTDLVDDAADRAAATGACAGPISRPTMRRGPFIGARRPLDRMARNFSVFNGTMPNGAWSLYVVDDGRGSGSFAGGWSLTITTWRSTVGGADDQRYCGSIDDGEHGDAGDSVHGWRRGHAGGQPDVEREFVQSDAGARREHRVWRERSEPDGDGDAGGGQTGSATITVTVSDGTNTASDTFVLTVNAVNTPPTITGIADQTINEDTEHGGD